MFSNRTVFNVDRHALNYALVHCFLNFFVCWHSKRAKQILRQNSHMNLFILIDSSITNDSEKDNDFSFSGDHHFFEQHNTISYVIDHYFMTAFTQFSLKTGINVKPRHTCKSSTAHGLGNTAQVHLHRQYCISSWGSAPKTTLKSLFNLQKKTIQSITNSDFQ